MLALRNSPSHSAMDFCWHRLSVGGLTLVWTLMAFAKYGALGTASPEVTGWGQAFVGAALWGSFAGSLLLLASSRWALQAFVTALVGVIGTALHVVALSDHPAALHEMPALYGTWLITITALYYTARIHALNLLR